MSRVVVVPEQSCVLLVGVVVILEFSGGRHILCPAIEGRPGVGSVQMDRVRGRGIVDKSHHGLRSARNDECRAWGYSVISDQICDTQIRIDRLSEWLDIHFIVLDIPPRDGVGEDSVNFGIVSAGLIVR